MKHCKKRDQTIKHQTCIEVCMKDDLVVYLCGRSYPLISRRAAGLGGELQDSQHQAQPQAQGQHQEHALQAVGLQGRGPGRRRQAAAGPPLTAQVRQLPRLAQLQDGHAQVLYHRRAWDHKGIKN